MWSIKDDKDLSRRVVGQFAKLWITKSGPRWKAGEENWRIETLLTYFDTDQGLDHKKTGDGRQMSEVSSDNDTNTEQVIVVVIDHWSRLLIV